MSREEYSWEKFKGTREEWAWFALESFDLPSAIDYDDVEGEIKIKELLKTRSELTRWKEMAES